MNHVHPTETHPVNSRALQNQVRGTFMTPISSKRQIDRESIFASQLKIISYIDGWCDTLTCSADYYKGAVQVVRPFSIAPRRLSQPSKSSQCLMPQSTQNVRLILALGLPRLRYRTGAPQHTQRCSTLLERCQRLRVRRSGIYPLSAPSRPKFLTCIHLREGPCRPMKLDIV